MTIEDFKNKLKQRCPKATDEQLNKAIVEYFEFEEIDVRPSDFAIIAEDYFGEKRK